MIRDPLYQTPEKPLVNAGLCALQLHDEPAAEGWLRRAVRVQPADPQGAGALAELLASQGHPGEAREILRPVLRNEQPPLRVLQKLIELDRELQDPEQQREHEAMLRRFYPEAAAASDGGARRGDAEAHPESRP